MSVGQGEPAIQGGSSESALGVRLHLCLNLAGLVICGVRHRRVRPADRGLAGQPFDAHGLRPGCAGASPICPTTGTRGCLGAPLRQRIAQYVSIRYPERLAEAGIEPSVGSRGDGYDNALAETSNGLYKAELIPPSRTLEKSGGGRTRHPGMGSLVQQPTTTRTDRLYPSGRG
jgi:hypothetical protein